MNERTNERRRIEMGKKSGCLCALRSPFFLHSFVNFLILYAQLPSIFLNLLSFLLSSLPTRAHRPTHTHSAFTATISFTFNYSGLFISMQKCSSKLCVDFPWLYFKKKMYPTIKYVQCARNADGKTHRIVDKRKEHTQTRHTLNLLNGIV